MCNANCSSFFVILIFFSIFCFLLLLFQHTAVQSESVNSSLTSPYVTKDRSSEETDLFKLLSNAINNGSLIASTEESTQRVFVPVTQPTKVQRKRGSTHASGGEGKHNINNNNNNNNKKGIYGNNKNNTSLDGQSREALSHEGSDPVSCCQKH